MNTITRHSISLISLILFSIFLPKVLATSNIDNTHKYAWIESTGWFNFHLTNIGVMVYPDHLEGYAWSGNIGWIKLGSYSGGDAHTYDNTDNTNWGVNRDSSGNLSGYAWGENIGWIKFNPSHSQVTIHPETGDFEGYAFSGNVGWIHFQNAISAYKVSYLVPVPPELPTELTNLSATPISPNQIKLSWQDNSTSATGFEIKRQDQLIQTTAANITNYHDSNLTCDTTYNYSVQALPITANSKVFTASATTWACSSSSNPQPTVPITDTTPPTTNLSATPISPNQIKLSWQDNSTHATGFEIKRQDQLIQTTAANITNYHDSNLTCDTTYNYSVQALPITTNSTVLTASATTLACSNSSNPQPTVPITDTTPPKMPPAPTNIINYAINMKGRTLTHDIVVMAMGSISNAIFTGRVKNQGRISNSTIAINATVSGGTVTGMIINQGTIADINFVGHKISGGTLAGFITNNSQVGGIIENVQLSANTIISGGILAGYIDSTAPNILIQDVQFTEKFKLRGGTLAGKIRGNPDNLAQISAAQIAPGTQLSYVRLSPTVQLPKEVIFGPGVEIPADPNHPTLMDFGIDPNQIPQWDETYLQQLELEIFRTLTAQQVKQIIPTLFTAINAKQLAKFSNNGISGITTQQFEYLPVESLSGLTANNMGGLTPDILQELTSNHVAAINAREFQQMSSVDISKFLVNLATDKVSFAEVERLIPPRWKLNLNTGALIAPIGSKLTLRTLPLPEDWPLEIILPDMIDLKKGFGIGGAGTPLLEELAASMESHLENLVLSQDDNGTLRVELTNDSDALYTFTADFDHIFQVADEEVSAGLSVDEGGFYSVTTPTGLQLRLNPALQDPQDLLSIFDVEIVMVGKRGEVLLEWSKRTRRAQQRHRAVGIPRANINKPRWRSRSNKSYRRQDDNNPEIFEKPGIYLLDNEVGQEKYIKVVYSNGMSQDFNPTVLSPDTFIAEGFKFSGIESLFFNTNGTFCTLYENKPHLLIPTIEIQNRNPLGNAVKSNLAITNNGYIQYAIELPIPTSIQKENSTTRQQLLFDLLIEDATTTNKCK